MVVSRHWNEPLSELGFVARSLAGAAGRFGQVTVLAPGAPGRVSADGAFDVQGIGDEHLRWPEAPPKGSVTIVDDLSTQVANLLTEASARDVFYVAAGDRPVDPSWRALRLYGDGEHDEGPVVQVHVPVNQLAQRHRHNGFGFIGYVLVLAGPGQSGEVPPPEAAWLTAAFHRENVIVVKDGTASAWRGRALRGRVPVDTRMDLWRLIAHAKVCVDLAPGPYLARECIEAMRFGTPVAVPQHSNAAASHSKLGGGWLFREPCDLLACVSDLAAEDARSAASERVRRFADANYGSSDLLVASLQAVIEAR